MAGSTLNGLPLLSARLHEPASGAWHGDFEVDTQDDVVGLVALLLEGTEAFLGTVYRGGVYRGRWTGRIVGGAGGLATVVGPTYYRGGTFGTIAADVLAAGGEFLDPASSATFTGFSAGGWQLSGSRAGDAIQTMVDRVNVGSGNAQLRWRVTRAGQVLVTKDTYPNHAMQFATAGRKPHLGQVTIAPLGAPTLVPGVSLDGEPIGRVLTELGDGRLRQTYWTEEA